MWGNSNKNWFCQNHKIIRTIPALQKRYLGEINCISRGLNACTNCTQKCQQEQQSCTSHGCLERASPYSCYPPPSTPLPTSPPLRQNLLRGEGPLPSQLLISPGWGPTPPRRRTLSWWCGEGHSLVAATRTGDEALRVRVMTTLSTGSDASQSSAITA